MTRTVVIRMAREKRLTFDVRGVPLDVDASVPLNRVEAAAFLDVTPDHLSRLTAAGEVPVHMLGNRPRFFRDELTAWLRAKAAA